MTLSPPGQNMPSKLSRVRERIKDTRVQVFRKDFGGRDVACME